ncbi:hypothetical protein ABZU94_13900 [Streptomyces mirabilis]|uniref:hypothetical protein n=1 Tax=Streptomyces sp. NPDC005388 TaxID=3156717 RepID=UPI0033B42BBD
MIDMKPWVSRAERIRDSDGYTYADLARALVDGLGWTAAVNVATGLRGHVYGWPGGGELHTEVRPLYNRLGWEQAALLASWFRDSRNWPNRHPQKGSR